MWTLGRFSPHKKAEDSALEEISPLAVTECPLPLQSVPVAALMNLVRVVWQYINNMDCLAVLSR